MTYPFAPQPVAESDKGLRLAALHLAAHVLDRPPVVAEESTTATGLAVVKEISAAARIAEVINGGTAIMEFIERTGAISPHKVALETLRDMLDGSDNVYAEPLRAVVRGALGGH